MWSLNQFHFQFSSCVLRLTIKLYNLPTSILLGLIGPWKVQLKVPLRVEFRVWRECTSRAFFLLLYISVISATPLPGEPVFATHGSRNLLVSGGVGPPAPHACSTKLTFNVLRTKTLLGHASFQTKTFKRELRSVQYTLQFKIYKRVARRRSAVFCFSSYILFSNVCYRKLRSKPVFEYFV